jgi:hypothetical protein
MNCPYLELMRSNAAGWDLEHIANRGIESIEKKGNINSQLLINLLK